MVNSQNDEKLNAAKDVVLMLKETVKSPFIARDVVAELTGGVINPRTLSNIDAAGSGPAGMFYIGRKVAYPTSSFCEWLAGRVSLEPASHGACKKVNV